jgi:hypothetical protein
VTVFKARRKVIPIDSFEQEEAGSMLKETTMKFCRELDVTSSVCKLDI